MSHGIVVPWNVIYRVSLLRKDGDPPLYIKISRVLNISYIVIKEKNTSVKTNVVSMQ